MISLVAAVALSLFASGRWTIPVAVWLAPLFFLRFLRGRKPRVGLAMAGAAFYIVQAIVWRGMVPVPGIAYYLVLAGIALAAFVPYVVDRLLAPRVAGFASTGVFPCAWVAAEYVSAAFSPYGTWGNAAYTQADALPLIQLVSVTGLWGVGFLIAWFGSAVNWAWERRFEWVRVRTGAIAFAGVAALVLFWGGARLLAPGASPVVRVASFTRTLPKRLDTGDLLRRPRRGAGLDSLRADLWAHEDTLLAWTRREAEAGARIVLWSETNALVLEEDEDPALAWMATTAREERIYLAAGIASFTPGTGFYENQLVVFAPSGKRLAQYHKARPVPGDPERGADREIPVFETSYGRVAGAICFDMDFPRLIRKAGRQRAGLILAPSSDWREIDPVHTHMAILRGVENGCSVVRQTNKGLSAAADERGRILAAVDFFRTRPHVMVAQVPVHRSPTIYSKVGDLFAYLCLLGLGWLVVVAWANPRSARMPPA